MSIFQACGSNQTDSDILSNVQPVPRATVAIPLVPVPKFDVPKEAGTHFSFQNVGLVAGEFQAELDDHFNCVSKGVKYIAKNGGGAHSYTLPFAVTFRAALNLTKKPLQLNQLRVLLSLDKANAQEPLQRKGDILFWQNKAPVEGSGWKNFNIPSNLGGVIAGRVFEVKKDFFVYKEVNGKKNDWIDLSASLSAANLDENDSTYVLFREPNAVPAEQNRLLLPLRPAKKACEFKFERKALWLNSNQWITIGARKAPLPGGTEPLFIPRSAEVLSLADKVIEETLPFPQEGKSLKYTLSSSFVSDASLNPNNANYGHFVPKTLGLQSNLSEGKTYEVWAHRLYELGQEPAQNPPQKLAEGTLTRAPQTVRLAPVEAMSAIKWVEPHKRSHTLVLELRVNGAHVAMGHFFQGIHLTSSKGTTWPF
jgi:hypothetical protein